CQQYDGLPYSF
nr:immunoglobulin light chain junction region [Macaca mulatta]MOW53690.1 immunoglobulin light chain junction region [Macaca mulatta]MOW53911.1 immunoglobulin light chain junction region [Macaca mulatta]MOX23860.1 immunoglobulin light chain junction region [Macaca mulatta]MOX27220.1 immunoglobulin light chain junction region [Macaca mulatta]